MLGPLILVASVVVIGAALMKSVAGGCGTPDPRPPSDMTPKERAMARAGLMLWSIDNRGRYGDPPGGPYTYAGLSAPTSLAPWGERDRWVCSQFQRQESPLTTRTDGELDRPTLAAIQRWAADRAASS